MSLKKISTKIMRKDSNPRGLNPFIFMACGLLRSISAFRRAVPAVLHAVLRGRHAGEFFEGCDEVALGAELVEIRDIGHGVVAEADKILGLFHAAAEDVVGKGASRFLFKKGGEVVGVYKRFFRDVRHGDFFAEVIVDVFDGVSYHL